MRTNIALLFVVGMIGCSGQIPATIEPAKPTPTKVPTFLPQTGEPTEIPTAIPTPTETAIPLPEYDAVHPFKFGTDESYVEFMNGTYTEIQTEDIGVTWVTPELTAGEDLTAELSHCMRKMIMANAYDGLELVAYKFLAYIHSGIAKCGQENAANLWRVFLEGELRFFIDFEARPAKMAEMIGKTVTFTQATGAVEMKITDIALVKASDWFAECKKFEGTSEYRACTVKANGSLDRFFASGSQPGVREMFVVFCSAEKDGDEYNKFILRLQE